MTEKIGNSVAKSLIDAKANALMGGKGGKDVMSLLGKSSAVGGVDWWRALMHYCCAPVQSNAAENEKGRMSVPEMFAQMRFVAYALPATSMYIFLTF